MTTLDQRLASLSAEKRALVRQRLAQKRAQSRADAIVARPWDPQSSDPLSFGQQRLWFLDQLQPDSALYNNPFVLRVRGHLDPAHLEQGLSALVARHEILRTRIVDEGGPVQRVDPAEPVRVPVHDLRDRGERRLIEAHALIEQAAGAPFDLERGGLVRALLVRLGDDDWRLLLTFHHMVSDGWSLEIVLRELLASMRAAEQGRAPKWPDLPIQYRDFARWQRTTLAPKLDEKIEAWKGRLAGAPALLELPSDRPRPAMLTYKGDLVRFELDRALTTQLGDLALARQSTLFMVTLAGFVVLLHTLSGQDDLVVGTAVSGRNRPELRDLVGFFVNSLALRLDASGDPTFEALVGRTRQTALEAFGRADVPFERIVDALQLERNLAANPVFQVMFILSEVSGTSFAGPGMSIEVEGSGNRHSRFDLTLSLTRRDGSISGVFEFATDLFDRSTIERWADAYTAVLRDVVEDPRQRIGALWRGKPLISRGRIPGTDHRCHQAFEQIVAQRRDHVAVECDGESKTYGQLDADANRVANALFGAGTRVGETVGLHLGRGVASYAAILGVWKAGAAYLPLDPHQPAARLAHMLRTSGLRTVLVEGDAPSWLPPEVTPLDLGVLLASRSEARAPPERPLPATLPAYVLHTSGSTGRTKGVCVSHGALMHFLRATAQALGWDQTVVMLAVTTLGFDISLLERIGPLLVGGRSVLASASVVEDGAALAALLGSSGATVMQGTPATWRLLQVTERGQMPRSRRAALCGGEALPVDLARWLVERHASAWNLYGPTETTVWSSLRRLGDDRAWPFGVVGVGEPLGQTLLAVVDAHLYPVPEGVWGELVIGGPGVSEGYQGQPGLTASRFVPDPWSARPGARIYRTGDVCRVGRDGGLEFAGRRDGQVKLRGFRIELGEIEAALSSHPSVATAAVVLWGTGEQAAIHATVTRRPGAPEIDDEEILAYVAAQVPRYMVPSRIAVMDALPLTPSGKVDRNALRTLAAQAPASASADAAPQTERQAALAAIYAEVLQRDSVGIDASFFALGGHSLLATQVVVRIRERLGIEVSVRQLFEHSTVAALARSLPSDTSFLRRSAEAPRSVGQRPQRIPLTTAQAQLWAFDRRSPADPTYVIPLLLRLEGPLDVSAIRRSLAQVVQRHEALRTTFAEHRGEPYQQVHPQLPPQFELRDLQGEDEPRRALARAVRDALGQGFDLAKGPLVRALVLHTAPDEYVALLTMHHIISDGWSVSVLGRELSLAYAAITSGQEPPWVPLPMQYADWVLMRAQIDLEPLDASMFDGWPDRMPLGDASARSRPLRGWSVRHGFALGGALTRAVDEAAQRHDVTVFMLLLTAYQLTLRLEAGLRDVVIGTPSAGREPSPTEGLIGYFVNTVLLRLRLDDGLALGELLERTRHDALEALGRRHRTVPPSRRTPAMGQLWFVLHNTPSPTLELHGVRWSTVDLAAMQPGEALRVPARYDLKLDVHRREDGLHAAFDGREGLFDRPTLEVFAQTMVRVLEQLCAATNPRVEALVSERARVSRRPKAASLGVAIRGRRRRAAVRADTLVRLETDPDRLVARATAERSSVRLLPWLVEHQAWVGEQLRTRGAVLFRGFHTAGAAALEPIVGAVAVDGPMPYEYRSTPRRTVTGRVLTSTEYPRDQAIPLHNELSYTRRWPRLLGLMCVAESREGGATPLADSRRVLGRVPAPVRDELEARGIEYVRQFGGPLDLRWQDVFQTEAREDVAAYCRAHEIDVEWMAGDALRTRQVCQATAVHPVTRERVWFNQAHLFHVSSLGEEARRELLSLCGPEGLPRNSFYGDGAPFESEVLDALRSAYQAEAVRFDWRQGDVLLLDNMLVAHGRDPYAGPRQVVVCMADAWSPTREHAR
ncbi:MAG: amino acid adenylation domain-containing protein [Myxococcota bacterium]